MDWLDRWDAALLAVTAYVAVISLVRLMRVRRDQLVADVQRQVQARKKQGSATQVLEESQKAQPPKSDAA